MLASSVSAFSPLTAAETHRSMPRCGPAGSLVIALLFAAVNAGRSWRRPLSRLFNVQSRIYGLVRKVTIVSRGRGVSSSDMWPDFSRHEMPPPFPGPTFQHISLETHVNIKYINYGGTVPSVTRF